MKRRKIFILLILPIIILSFVSCNKIKDKKSSANNNQAPVQNTNFENGAKNTSKRDSKKSDYIDISTLSGTAAYAQVYGIISESKRYEGKTIKLKGTFQTYSENGKTYFACIVSDTAGCCVQGLEFEPLKKYSYPKDFPKPEETITVKGKLKVLNKDKFDFCVLQDAEILPS